jgi:hypothetical protein
MPVQPEKIRVRTLGPRKTDMDVTKFRINTLNSTQRQTQIKQLEVPENAIKVTTGSFKLADKMYMSP